MYQPEEFRIVVNNAIERLLKNGITLEEIFTWDKSEELSKRIEEAKNKD